MKETALLLKIISISFLLFLTFKLPIDTLMQKEKYFSKKTGGFRSLALSVFALSIAGYLACQLVHVGNSHPGLFYFVRIICFMVPWAFLVMSQALFEDNFRYTYRHLLLFLFIEAVHFILIIGLHIYDRENPLSGSDYLIFLRAIPQTISVSYILFSLGQTLTRRIHDLDENRRKFRIQFVLINSIYMLIVLIAEIALQGKAAPELLDIIHAGFILITVLYFSHLLLISHGFREINKENQKKLNRTAFNLNENLLGKLDQAMKEEKFYTQESLTIGILARHLGIQEYILRRQINAGLGYRNFNDYLNEIRIQEACHRLSNNEFKEMPIIRIAMDLGFGSLAPFNKAFKEKTKVTPTEYRRKNT